MKQAIEKTRKRMQEMRDMPAGWNDGSGEAIPNMLVDVAELVIIRLIEAGAPKPLIGPTVDDVGISCEWHADWFVGFEIIEDNIWVEFRASKGYKFKEKSIKMFDRNFISETIEFLKQCEVEIKESEAGMTVKQININIPEKTKDGKCSSQCPFFIRKYGRMYDEESCILNDDYDYCEKCPGSGEYVFTRLTENQ